MEILTQEDLAKGIITAVIKRDEAFKDKYIQLTEKYKIVDREPVMLVDILDEVTYSIYFVTKK